MIYSKNIAAGVAAYVFLTVSSGCQSTDGRFPLERFDGGTGTTIASSMGLMVYARIDSQFARSARDYVYLGPIETNRQGLREYFLWVGIATTIDRGYLAPETPPPVKLEMTIRDEPMEFPLTAWPPPYLSPSLSLINETSVAMRGVFAARVTLDQLRLINDAQPPTVRVYGSDDRAREFDSWSTSARWDDFFGGP